ncbi:hypothetical protein YPPY13_2828, partial [Yersinia pestis PY-13]|jgi:regulator of chromosome condensation
MAKK